jgi:hypothetical protein
MAKRKDIEATGSDQAAQPPSAPEQVAPELTASAPSLMPAADAANLDSEADAEAEAKAAAKAALLNSLPAVESPSLSPAVSEPVAVEESAIKPKPEPEVEAARAAPSFALVPIPRPSAEHIDEPGGKQTPPRFALRKRHKRYARLAASVAIGAIFGAAVGAVITGGFATLSRSTVAGLKENKAMQQSVAKLADDVTALKAKLAAANKLAQAQTAERLKQASAEITGSISVPQTVPAAVTPLPTPRPAPRIAMAETQPARAPVVPDWTIRDSRGGYVYVEGHGDIYQVVPGAPLPGLGPVQSIKKLEGRWVVTTPKGIIVSMRDRRYFE